jgi:hypothetical protein
MFGASVSRYNFGGAWLWWVVYVCISSLVLWLGEVHIGMQQQDALPCKHLTRAGAQSSAAQCWRLV